MVYVSAESQDGRVYKSGVVFAKEENTTYIFTIHSSDLNEISVTLDSGLTIPAEFVGRDDETGLTLLKVEEDFEINPLRLGDSGLIEQGEYNILLGGRRSQTASSPVSFGIVTEPGQRRLNGYAWSVETLETDALTNEEFVGGGMFDIGGELIGIVIDTPTGTYDSVGYGIGVNEAKIIYQQLLEGEITRGALGIVARNVESLRAYEKNVLNIALDQVDGVLVMNTYGISDDLLQQGDIITAIDNTLIPSISSMTELLYKHNAGDEVKVQFIRNGEEMEEEIELQ